MIAADLKKGDIFYHPNAGSYIEYGAIFRYRGNERCELVWAKREPHFYDNKHIRVDNIECELLIRANPVLYREIIGGDTDGRN